MLHVLGGPLLPEFYWGENLLSLVYSTLQSEPALSSFFHHPHKNTHKQLREREREPTLSAPELGFLSPNLAHNNQ
jgi:hypothetical protein